MNSEPKKCVHEISGWKTSEHFHAQRSIVDTAIFSRIKRKLANMFEFINSEQRRRRRWQAKRNVLTP